MKVLQKKWYAGKKEGETTAQEVSQADSGLAGWPDGSKMDGKGFVTRPLP